MANLNQVITLGVGTPSGITEFLTFGLQIGEVVVVIGEVSATFTARQPELTYTERQPEATYTAKQPAITFTK
jgi:hypothetical protein